jgi:hypothetical protein
VGEHGLTAFGAFGRVGRGMLFMRAAFVPFGFGCFTFWQCHEQSPKLLKLIYIIVFMLEQKGAKLVIESVPDVKAFSTFFPKLLLCR